MPKIPLTALKDHVYGGRRIKAGADYETTGQSDARLMKALGRAKDRVAVVPVAVASIATPAASYSTRMMSAAVPVLTAHTEARPLGRAEVAETGAGFEVTVEPNSTVRVGDAAPRSSAPAKKTPSRSRAASSSSTAEPDE